MVPAWTAREEYELELRTHYGEKPLEEIGTRDKRELRLVAQAVGGWDRARTG